MSAGPPKIPLPFPDERTSSAMLDALVGPRDEPTLQPCARCGECPACHGSHLATAEQNAEWRRRGERKGAEP